MKKGFLFFSTIFVVSFAFGFGYGEEHNKIKKEEYFDESVTIKEESQLIEVKYNSIDKIEIEINTKLPKISDYMNESLEGTIKYYKNNTEMAEKEVLKNIGEYIVKISIDNQEYTSTLIVKDTVKPKLTLKGITIYKGTTYNINSFVKSCTDNSNLKCDISFKDTKMANYKNAGSYDITIIAKDKAGNEVQSKTKLVIKDKQTNITSNKANTTISKKSNKNATKNNNINDSTTKFKNEAKKLISVNKADAQKILDLTNQYRKEKNIKALKLDSQLCQAANVRAMELATYNYFEHARPNGAAYWTILNDLNISRKTSGENIAFGYSSAEEVSQAWKDSKGHYANMINAHYTNIGIGEYTLNGITYHVQIFTSK